jgi:AcrR family transcriptional regulator
MYANMKHKAISESGVSTKESLLSVGVDLFARYGFDATTTRMIAKAANANIAAISFHFGSKETFYNEVLSYVAEYMKGYFAKLGSKVSTARESGPVAPELAWEFIGEYVDLILAISRESVHPEYLILLFREQMINAPNAACPLTRVLCENAEAVLSGLLEDYWRDSNKETCDVVSHAVTGAVISLGDHPMFLRYLLDNKANSGSNDKTWETLAKFVLNSIKTFR